MFILELEQSQTKIL